MNLNNKPSFLIFVKQHAKNLGIWGTLLGSLLAIITWVGQKQASQNQHIAQYAVNQDKLNDVISEQEELKDTLRENQQFDLQLIFRNAQQRCHP